VFSNKTRSLQKGHLGGETLLIKIRPAATLTSGYSGIDVSMLVESGELRACTNVNNTVAHMEI